MMKTNGGLRGQYHFQSASFYAASPWCNSAWKRGYDIFGAILLLIVFLPLMIVVALGVKFTSRGPIFFRQRRPGKNSHEFSILKFRTMKPGSCHAGPVLTQAADPRVTWFGRHMRKWKLDELPQLLNVLRGDMSFVGPRPQPTRLWNEPSIQEEASCILSVRPGITSHATLNFRNEEELLALLPSEELEEVYTTAIMPLKLKMDIGYLQSANLASDLGIVFKTMFRIFSRQEENNEILIRGNVPVLEQRKYQPFVEQSD
jgi:lipopolysaccharide/colanic/teichoic acid biosynthesis glycosyltransferase